MGKSLKEKILSKELTIGSWVMFGHPLTCEMMAKSGFDWLVIDMEHAALSSGDMLRLVQVVDLAGCVPLVRVGANDPLLIKHAMDAGARGVVVPMVNTPEEAKRAVNALYYPPRGTRGVGLSRAQDFGMGLPRYIETAVRETILIVQIEHHVGVANMEEILAVDGVDGFIIGPYDLSGSVGVPGRFDHPDMQVQIARIKDVMHRSAKPGGLHVVSSDRAVLEDSIAQGYRFLAYGVDMVFLAEKLRDEGAALDGLRQTEGRS